MLLVNVLSYLKQPLSHTVTRCRAFMGALLVLSLTLDLAGCSAVPVQGEAKDNPQRQINQGDQFANPDPWERFNRTVTHLNDKVDAAFAKPLAQVYVEVTPNPVRTGVSNFFFNLASVPSAVNNLLQGNLRNAAEGVMRVGINTLLGLGGLIDLASEMKIERHRADFGQTLGKWGVPTGPYLVLPVLGPSTLRDSIASAALPRDEMLRHVRRDSVRYSMYFVRAIEQRANLLRATGVMDEAALDKYSFTRDVFLQVRRNEIDGDPSDPPIESGATDAPN